MRKILYILSLLLPWPCRRFLLCRLWGFDIHATAHIGLSWITPAHLKMGPHASIGHLSVCKNCDLLQLDAYASIGNGNWITGYPKVQSSPAGPAHFAHQKERFPELIVEEHAAVTNRHLIDCTSRVRIGRFATLAGFASQILTHSIDLAESRQDSAPITIGAFCFVGTNTVILGGSNLPDFCILGAKSLLQKSFVQTHTLYAGVPARPIKAVDPSLKYFHRTEGFVV